MVSLEKNNQKVSLAGLLPTQQPVMDRRPLWFSAAPPHLPHSLASLAGPW